MPTLRTVCLSAGLATTAPTSTGTPIASTAPWIAAAAAGSVYGSMSEEFSGQITRSRPRLLAGGHLGGERRGWPRRGCRGRRPADRRRPAPCAGRCPGPRPRSPGASAVGTGTANPRSGTATATAAPQDRASPCGEQEQAPLSATAKVTSGIPPRAANRAYGASAWAKASRPQGNPPKGSWDRTSSDATHRQARPKRPPGQPLDQGETDEQQRHEGGLEEGEQDPRVRADDEQPAQQQQEEREPEDRPQQQGAPQPLPPRQPGGHCDAHRCQRPHAVGREGQRQRGAGDRRDQQATRPVHVLAPRGDRLDLRGAGHPRSLGDGG